MRKRKIVITGAGSGLGKMAAIKLARRGHTVFATTHYEEECVLINNTAKDENLDLKSFKLDVLIEEDRNKLLDIDFDVLINNAAIGDSGSISEINIERIKNVFETNVFSNIVITQIAIDKFINNKSGRIIFLSSLAGKIPISFLSPYCATKFAINCFATCLRNEVKKIKNTKIDVGIIELGAYATGFNKENYEKKYKWMEKKSYFKYDLNNIKRFDKKMWNFIESKNFSTAIKQYIKAVENKKLKFRYTSPKLQAFVIQFCRILGF